MAAPAQEESQHLDKVTDYVEDKDLDAAKVTQAMVALSEDDRGKEEERARERELAAVRVEAADVELIANELEIPKDKADRVLREHGGDVGRALQSLVLNA